MDTWETKAHSFMLVSFMPNTPAGHEISNAPAPVQSEQRDASSQKRSFFSSEYLHHSPITTYLYPLYPSIKSPTTPMITWDASAHQYSPCAKQVWYILILQSARRSPQKCLCQASTRTLLAGFPLLKAGPKLAMMAFKQADHPKCGLDPLQYLDSEKTLDGLEEWIDMNQHVIPTPSHKIQIIKTISKLETSNDSNGWSVTCAISWKQKHVHKFCLCLLGFVPSNHLPKVKQRYHRSVPVRKQTSVPSFRDVWSFFKVFVLQFSSLKKWASTKIQCVSLSGVSMLDNCL